MSESKPDHNSKFDDEGWPSAEEKAKSIEIRKRLEGTSLEMVRMVEGRKLIIQTLAHLVGGGMAEGEVEASPGTQMYDDLLREHGPLEVGGTHAIRRKLVGEEWVRLPDSETYIEQDDDDD